MGKNKAEKEKCPHCNQPLQEKNQAWGNKTKICTNPECPSKKKTNGWGN